MMKIARASWRLLAAVVARYALRCHAYCQMTNHYHLAVTTTDPNLSRAVKQLNGEYAQWWNWRHQRTGHVFQGRFHAQIVQDERYLLNVCRYIVLNPVRSGMVRAPEEWPWSSYPAMMGMVAVPPFLDCRRLLEMAAPGDPSAGRARFRDSVLTVESGPQRLSDAAILGDDAFVARFRLLRRHASREVPRGEGRPTLDAIFLRATTRLARDHAILTAHSERFAITEIARYLNLHRSTVSKIVAARGQTVKNPPVHDLTPPDTSDITSRAAHRCPPRQW